MKWSYTSSMTFYHLMYMYCVLCYCAMIIDILSLCYQNVLLCVFFQLQYWMMSKDGEIRRDEGCMDYAGQFVMIYPCHSMKGNQEWVYGQVSLVASLVVKIS